MNHLYERELHLEEQAILGGIQRYRKHLENGQLAALPPGKTLYRGVIDAYAVAVEEFVVGVLEGNAKRKTVAALLLAETETHPVLAAAIAARRIINGLTNGGGEGLTAMAISIGGLIEEAAQWETFTQEQPKLARSLEAKISKMTTERYRRACMRHVQRNRTKAGSQTADWTRKQKLDVGAKLIEIFEDVSKYITVGRVTKGRAQVMVRPTEELLVALEDMHKRAELFSPMYMPMVVPPKDWTKMTDGGYVHGSIKRRPLVRTRGYDLLEEIGSVDMPEVYDAVNTVQNTAWRVNFGVLRVLEQVLDGGHSVAGIPSSEPIPMPERPAEVPEDVKLSDLSPEHKALIDDYRARKSAAHTAEGARRSRWITIQAQRGLASLFAQDEALFFPHYLDFRGRMYPLPTGMTPQGNDLGRALLEFADGLPLGENGGYWLAIQVANQWGQDKLPLDERAKWTVDHTDLILDSAFRPLDGHTFWLDADKPWGALAAAFEWAGFMIQGDDYVSHLPIAMDGTCSGLQHYSALLRDEIGGKAVNLTNDGVRHDIYGEVAEKVQALLRPKDCQGGDDSFRELGITWQSTWDGKVSRSLVKRPVMTYAYSVTAAGMRDQVVQEIKKDDLFAGVQPPVDPWAAAMFISTRIHYAIENTVVAASNAMSYLKEVAREVTDAGLPIKWRSPCGLPVIQRTWATESVQGKVMYAGQRVDVRFDEDLDRLDKRAQTSGVAPNFIHSMDAAHLMRTVNALRAEGVEHFAMIHDSFGTHAANTDLLNHVLREEFVRMYTEEDWLAKFAESQPVVATVEGLQLPAKGSLDLNQVLNSEFFFS
jgi:DNA-directed RNA polymerase